MSTATQTQMQADALAAAAAAAPSLLDSVVQETHRHASVYDKVKDPLAFAKELGQSLYVAFGLNSPHHGVIMAMTCQAEELSFSDYMKRYHGDGSMRATAIQAEFQSRGGRIKWESIGEDGKAVALFSHPRHQPEPMRVSYTIQDAKLQVGEKFTKDGSNWSTNPSAMLRAALIRKAVKIIDPGIIAGYDDFNDMDTDEPAATAAAAKAATVADRQAQLAALANEQPAEVAAEVPETAVPAATESAPVVVVEESPIADEPVVSTAPKCTNEQLVELVALGKQTGLTLEQVSQGVCRACDVSQPKDATAEQIANLIARFRSELSKK
jgi:hypothetical protein